MTMAVCVLRHGVVQNSRLSCKDLGSVMENSMLRIRSTTTPCRAVPASVTVKGPICMAHPRRVQMVAQQIKREVSCMMVEDDVLRSAVVPEHALGADKFMSAIATVSDVEVSADLQVAKIYVSVIGEERDQVLAIEGLQGVARYVRAGLGRKMRLRFTPEVRFIQDDSIERGSRVLSIISRLEKEREARERGVTLPFAPLYDDDEEESILGKPIPAQRRKRAPQAQKRPPATQKESLDGKNRKWQDGGINAADFLEDDNIFLV